MAFFDKLNDFAKTVGDKAGEAIETTKLNSKINSEKSSIDTAIKKIGEYYYAKYQAGEGLPEEASALCVEIDGYNAAIAEAKAEIERIKTENEAASTSAPAASSDTACPSCGKSNAAGTKFCAECGGKLEASRICVCGAEVAPGIKFCGECGEPMQ